MRQSLPAQLFDRHTADYIPAELILGLTVDEVDEAAALWSPYLKDREKVTGHRPEHAHWDWSKKARAISASPNYLLAGVAIEGELQALILWDEDLVKGRHPDHLGFPLVYVQFVSTAPWNDPEVVDLPKYKGAGTLLLRAAIERSIDLGYKGRLGLHALPQAEIFYKNRCQMAELGIDTSGSHKGLRCYEFTSELANTFIKRLKEGGSK